MVNSKLRQHIHLAFRNQLHYSATISKTIRVTRKCLWTAQKEDIDINKVCEEALWAAVKAKRESQRLEATQ